MLESNKRENPSLIPQAFTFLTTHPSPHESQGLQSRSPEPQKNRKHSFSRSVATYWHFCHEMLSCCVNATVASSSVIDPKASGLSPAFRSEILLLMLRMPSAPQGE